jgi:hypothetical protein
MRKGKTGKIQMNHKKRKNEKERINSMHPSIYRKPECKDVFVAWNKNYVEERNYV